MKHKLFFSSFFLILFFFPGKGSTQVVDSTVVPGGELKTFYSKLLGENRRISIQTPTNMNAFDAYPVLYVLDGEAQAILAEGQVLYLSESYKIIPKLIIVGIQNTDRTRDLTPTHDITGADGKPDTSSNAFGRTSGGGEKFLRFIKEELMPYIQARYPVAPYNILYGHSLGALMAVYCLANHPDYFDGYIAVSPSLQWDKKSTLKQVQQRLNVPGEYKRILFFSDANEDSAFHSNQLELDLILQQKKWPNLSYKRMFYPDETHISEPVKAFYDGLRTIYPAWHLPYNSSAFKKRLSAQIIKDHYSQLSKTYGYTVIPLHDELIQIARFLRNDTARINDAIELLLWNANNFPVSAVNQETLGDTYAKTGNKESANSAYKKALVLDPANKKIADKIAQLK